LLDGVVIWDALDDSFVDLVDLVTGVGEAVNEVAVGAEEQDSLAVHIEATDVADLGRGVRNEVVNAGDLVFGFGTNDITVWFMQENRDVVAGEGEGLAVDLDGLGYGIGAFAEVGNFSIDGDATGDDELLTGAAAAVAGTREQLL
jgi:hypothetical protein